MAAREAYSLYAERAAEGANEAGGPFSAAYSWPLRYERFAAIFPFRRARTSQPWTS